MKPEHFIYKSDGLYYIPNMPEGYFYTNDPVGFRKALERAKAEAIRICDEHQEILKKKIYDADPGRNTGVDTYFKEGEIYTINMEEKIEIYDMELKSCEYCQNCKLIPVCTTLAARIAAPKKEDFNPFIPCHPVDKETHGSRQRLREKLKKIKSAAPKKEEESESHQTQTTMTPQEAASKNGVETMHKIHAIADFKKHFEKFRSEPFKSSLLYWMMTGTVSGNFAITIDDFVTAG